MSFRFELNKVGHKSKVFADGVELDGVRSVEVSADAENLTCAKMEVFLHSLNVELDVDQVDVTGIVFGDALLEAAMDVVAQARVNGTDCEEFAAALTKLEKHVERNL